MAPSPSRGPLRRSLLALVASSALLSVAASASAASSVTYIDGHEVWVAALDGSRKERLSGGEGDWIAVTAADNGRVFGVRLEAGKIFQLARIQLWESDGRVLSQGPLPSTAGWTSYVAPLGLDLTSDGVFAVYGYSGQVGFVPNATFPKGHYAILSDTKTNLTPIGQSGYLDPTTIGRRVVAAQGSQVVIQAADSGNPFATSWTPIIDVSGTGLELGRTDVAATGRLAAIELASASGDDKIGVVSLSGIDAPVTVGATTDCFLPTVGEASDPTISQDGASIAWKDAQGVKVAGAPSGTTEPCALSSPPVVISPTGSSPSIGGASVAQLRPSAPAPPATPTSPTPRALTVTRPAKATVVALAAPAGLALKVSAPTAGRVTVTGSVTARRLGLRGAKPVVVATGTAVATGPGAVTVRVRLKRTARRYRARLRGATLVLRLRQGGTTTRTSIRLR